MGLRVFFIPCAVCIGVSYLNIGSAANAPVSATGTFLWVRQPTPWVTAGRGASLLQALPAAASPAGAPVPTEATDTQGPLRTVTHYKEPGNGYKRGSPLYPEQENEQKRRGIGSVVSFLSSLSLIGFFFCLYLVYPCVMQCTSKKRKVNEPPLDWQPVPQQQSIAMTTLAGTQGIYVKEKLRWAEVASEMLGAGIDMGNKYKILDASSNSEIMFAEEQTTSFCKRQARSCYPDCAPWSLDIRYTYQDASDSAFAMDRDFSFTCCCINRPFVSVTNAHGGQEIGTIHDPSACCDQTFTLKDASGQSVMSVVGGCCQCGLLCPLPCGPCSKVNFEITDLASGQQVGHVQKKVPGCGKWFLDDSTDNYKVDFGQVEKPELKALLTALAIFIDFRYFGNNNG